MLIKGQLLELVKPEYRQMVIEKANEAQNFFQHSFRLLRHIPFKKSIRIWIQCYLRDKEKSIRPYGLRIRTDWLWGMVRHDYVFHGVVLLVDGAKE